MMAAGRNARYADQFARELNAAARQVPFALSLSLNRTSTDIQRAEIERAHNVFQIKATRFFGTPAAPHRGFVRRTKKATKRDPTVELEVRPPGGRDRARVITRHERGGIERPEQSRALMVPIEAPETSTGRIRKSARPRELGFVRVDGGGAGAEIYRSRTGRTFMIRNPDGTGLILRKRGRGRFRFDGHNQVLFSFQKSVRIEPRLEFFETAERTFKARFRDRFVEAYREALATAR